jgi:hypothetical protein
MVRRKPQPDLDERLRRSRLGRYLLADEVPILAQHQHWAALWKPVALVVGGLFVVAALALVLPASLDSLNPFLLLGWFLLVGWAGWRLLEWKREWLVATDKRLLVNYGVINEGVVMISLSRVVDMTYTRSRLGRLLGYGELQRESQKHPDSMHKIKWVKNPDGTYLTICAAIFDLQDRMFGMDEVEHEHRIENVPPPHAPGLYAGNASPAEPRGPGDTADEDVDSAGIQIHYGVSRHYDRDPWHLSPDLRDPALHDADTGPIPYRRSATDDGEWQSTTSDPVSDRDRNRDRDRDRDRDRARDRDRDRDRDHDRDLDRDRDRDQEHDGHHDWEDDHDR